jgi:hypothetical protein
VVFSFGVSLEVDMHHAYRILVELMTAIIFGKE